MWYFGCTSISVNIILDRGSLCGILAVQVLASKFFWIKDPCVVFWLFMY